VKNRRKVCIKRIQYERIIRHKINRQMYELSNSIRRKKMRRTDKRTEVKEGGKARNQGVKKEEVVRTGLMGEEGKRGRVEMVRMKKKNKRRRRRSRSSSRTRSSSMMNVVESNLFLDSHPPGSVSILHLS
jgi:hypothetical protein